MDWTSEQLDVHNGLTSIYIIFLYKPTCIYVISHDKFEHLSKRIAVTYEKLHIFSNASQISIRFINTMGLYLDEDHHKCLMVLL